MRLLEIFTKEQGTFANWFPVFIGAGIGLYFSLPFEPSLQQSLIIFCGLWSVVAGLYYFFPAFIRHNSRGSAYTMGKYLFIAAALASTGFVSATYRTDRIAAPAVEREFGPSYFEGRVVQIEPSSPGQRYLLDNLSGKAFKWLSTPHIMRLKSNLQQENIRVGMRVRVLAVIQPPARPSIPGGFNYARHAYYQQIGAVGYILGRVKIVEELSSREKQNDFNHMGMTAAETRNSIVRKVGKHLEGDQKDLVVTFLTGQKGGLSKRTKEEIRDAGLAHLLAISGLHMGLMAGILFFVIRFVLALFPSVALNFPIKKIAAIAAIFFCFFYLLLINHPLSAQRAFIMIAVSLSAVVLDRKALSIRTVSVAAVFLLVIYPEVLISASFQMSFSAVLALVAFFEWYSHKNVEQNLFGKMLNGIKLTCYCSLVASIATAPFVLYHFHNLPLYGILANLVAVPFTAFVLMPLVLVCYLLLPFGMEGWAVLVLGQAFEFLLWIARVVAHIPHGAWRLSAFPVSMLAFVTFGGIWLCLFKTKIRWAGSIPVAIFVIYINTVSGKPDVLIDPKSQLVGIAIGDTLYLNNTRRSRFVARIWKQDLALENVRPWEELSRDYLKCDAEACRLTLQETKLSFIKNGTAFSEECNQGGLLIAARQKIPRWCHQNSQDGGNRALDYWSLRKGGVHSISLKQGAPPNIQTVSEFTGNRPWNRGD
ncbi:ComEC/Rec2 family competence protein [Kiloniella majae]|uniref:ComEC/Rec2 family competence protein n=1 Tax=Kiloniella majae TaxID=1938558 RepID=UPI000A277341|nr:ComEC/Rec2 family competence protein [Kiloniella majae]